MPILPSSDSSYGLTLKDMIDEVADQCGNEAISDKIIRWINNTIFELVGVHTFPGFETMGILNVETKNPNYSLPVDLMKMRAMWNPERRNPVNPIDSKTLSYIDPWFQSRPGSIFNYVRDGQNITLYMVPARPQLLPYIYTRRPRKLVDLTDVSDLPFTWHPVIQLGALHKALRQEDNPKAESVKAEREELEARLARELKYNPDYLHILQDPAKLPIGRLGRPLLPSSYPRIF